MEESFKARVDRVFGSLAADAQRPESLWTLTDEEIERKEWIRAKKTPTDLDQHGVVSSSRRGKDGDNELDDGDEGEDDAAGPSSSILDAKPDDHDEDEWLIRTSVGMDSTLDKEEEEDEFDQIAVGIDKAVDKIEQYADDFEDEEAKGEFDSSVVSAGDGVMIASNKASYSLPDDGAGVKSILKKDEKNLQRNSLKRVRFDPESGSGVEEKGVDRSVKFAAGPEVESRVSFPPPGTDPRVPDYLRNPSKYTQYTLDSGSELNDGEANRKAYMDFFNLIRGKHAVDTQPDEDMSDLSKPIAFVPRKKTGDDVSVDISQKDNVQGKVGSSVVIAAADEVCAMEEDETEAPVSNTVQRKPQRQYRAKATLEPLDD